MSRRRKLRPTSRRAPRDRAASGTPLDDLRVAIFSVARMSAIEERSQFFWQDLVDETYAVTQSIRSVNPDINPLGDILVPARILSALILDCWRDDGRDTEKQAMLRRLNVEMCLSRQIVNTS